MKRINNVEKIFIIVSSLLTFLFIAFLIIAKWPRWWEWIVFERTPMTWFESILLYTCSFLCFLCAILSNLKNDPKDIKWWLILGISFFYLTFDERFAIHERIRDNFLAVNDINLPFVSWVAPGDFILLVFMILGLAFLPWILKLFRKRKIALILFIIGIIISGIAVILDSFNIHKLSLESQRLEQTIEEIIETFGMLVFVNSLFLIFSNFLTDINNPLQQNNIPDNS